MDAQPGLRLPLHFPQLQTSPEESSLIPVTLDSVMHGSTLTRASGQVTLPTCQATHLLERNHPPGLSLFPQAA